MFDLRGILQEHPDCLKNHDRRKLKGILTDLYPDPGEKRRINLVLETYDSGIPDQLVGVRELDAIRMQTLVHILMDEHGMREEIAEEGIQLWADALGVKYPPRQSPSAQKLSQQKPNPPPQWPAPVQQAPRQQKPAPPLQMPTQQKTAQQKSASPSQMPIEFPHFPFSYPQRTAQPKPPNTFQFVLGEEADGWYIKGYRGTLLESLTIPAVVDGKKVIGISDEAFGYSGSSNTLLGRESGKALRRVSIEAGIQHIGKQAFYFCERLQSVYLPETLKTIGCKAFHGCDILSFVNLPNGLTEIQDGAFEYCKKLTSISIPGSVVTIGCGAFMGCENLESVKFSHGLEIIKLSAFRDCPKLKEAILPNSVKTIGDFAFSDDSGLKRLRLGEDIRSIGEEAFLNCSLLRDVILPRSLTSMGRDPFHTYLEDWYTTGTWNWRRRSFLEKIKTLAEVSLRDWLRRLRKDPTVTDSGPYRKNKQLTMYCHKGTYGAAYARRAGYRVRKPVKAPAYLR